MSTATHIDTDQELAAELVLFAENHEPLYRQYLACIANLQRKIKKNVYDHTLAHKLWLYWIEEASREYRRTIDSSARFSPLVRKLAAREVADSAFEQIQSGAFD